MHSRVCIALMLLVASFVTSAPGSSAPGAGPRRANLQRAATLPWKDGGQCAVREAALSWTVLAERCYQALDHDRLTFHDFSGRCAVASAGAAAVGIGLCVLVAPEVLLGAVVVTGVVVVGVALQEALEAYALSREPSPGQRPQSDSKGPDLPPFAPIALSEEERRRRCEPIPVPHRGGDEAHNQCADRFPPNRYPGMDVLVDGKHFDALQVGVRVLWEIKTDRFDTHSEFLQEQVLTGQVRELLEERGIAAACGYGFVVGVSSEAHAAALKERTDTLDIVVTGCER
ncbi:MAG: DUF6310 domain-containing protein [Cystobacter sp.]